MTTPLYCPCRGGGGVSGGPNGGVRPLALARLTSVLLKGGDVIRGHASEYKMCNIINKLTLLKWGV